MDTKPDDKQHWYKDHVMSMKIHKAILSAIVAVWAIGTARADAIYHYMGNPFTFVVAPYTTSDRVYMILTFAHELPAGLASATVNPTAMTIEDGMQTLTMSTPGTVFAVIVSTQTGALPGAIADWSVVLAAPGGLASISSSAAEGGGDMGSYNGGEVYANNTDIPGIWWGPSSSNPIPEPSSLPLSALALTALMWTRTRRSFRNPKAQGTRLGKAA